MYSLSVFSAAISFYSMIRTPSSTAPQRSYQYYSIMSSNYARSVNYTALLFEWPIALLTACY